MEAETAAPSKAPFGVIGCGALGLITAMGISVVTTILPAVAHVSPDEQIPGYALSSGCCCMSFLILLGGIVFLVVSRKG